MMGAATQLPAAVDAWLLGVAEQGSSVPAAASSSSSSSSSGGGASKWGVSAAQL
jgi:hypothetical protein